MEQEDLGSSAPHKRARLHLLTLGALRWWHSPHTVLGTEKASEATGKPEPPCSPCSPLESQPSGSTSLPLWPVASGCLLGPGKMRG